jgi:phosphoribosylformimino-5-aminoimidazole carboxamide ribotide isomerase
MVDVSATSDFDILPAIDLRGGRVVRLRQGDYGRETAYSDDAIEVARRFVREGARSLHVVDLDGARTGEPAHPVLIGAIVAAVGDSAAVEVAGGLRTQASIGAALKAGAARVVLGTAALQDPAFVAAVVAAHGPERVAVALDVRDGRAVGEGWAAGAEGLDVDDALRSLSCAGIETFEVTAIERDGLLGGPDLDLLGRTLGLTRGRGRVIASGGVRSLADLRAIRATGCAGAIVGRALYEGSLDLAEATRQAGLPLG